MLNTMPPVLCTNIGPSVSSFIFALQQAQTVTQRPPSKTTWTNFPRVLPRPQHPPRLPRRPTPRPAACHEVRICATRTVQGLRTPSAPPRPTPVRLLRDPRTRLWRPPLPTGRFLRRCLVRPLRKRRLGSRQDRCAQQQGRGALTRGPV